MEIKKLKLVKIKGGHCLTVFYNEKNPADPEDGMKNKKALVSPKLYDAVQALAIHYAILQGYVATKEVDIALPDPRLTEKFAVHGYSIGGDEENPGIMISATLRTFRKKASNGNSPFDEFNCAPEARYEYMDDLLARLRVIEHHVAKYLSGEERGEPRQEEPAPEPEKARPELFDQPGTVEGEAINKAQILPPAGTEAAGEKRTNTDRRGNRRVAQTPKNRNGLAGKE